jgi:hypothetical protein
MHRAFKPLQRLGWLSGLHGEMVRVSSRAVRVLCASSHVKPHVKVACAPEVLRVGWRRLCSSKRAGSR